MISIKLDKSISKASQELGERLKLEDDCEFLLSMILIRTGSYSHEKEAGQEFRKDLGHLSVDELKMLKTQLFAKYYYLVFGVEG